MSLTTARLPTEAFSLPGSGPWPTDALVPLVGRAFRMDADDGFVSVGDGPEHAYLRQSREAWDEHPDHMDFLDEDSPIRVLKHLERDLYLDTWGPALAGAQSVLDVGCGIGRFALWALDEGKDVHGVDPDLASLRRLVWRSPGRPGRLDVSWSGAHTLPEGPFDAAIACEVLCYVPDHVGALDRIVSRLRPGGVLCLSVEARWGWAAAVDASPGAIGHALVGDGVVDLPGEGWVRTWEEDDLRAWIEGAGLVVERIDPHHYVLDGPLERVAPEAMDLDVLLDLEAAARHHPAWSALNRIWSVVARRPQGP